jgi:maltose alpha-D-glucosyltransferase/alpha-amylase
MSPIQVSPSNNPLWYRNAVFYEVFLRAFSDGNGDGIGDLAGLTQKLDYLQRLGVDCIWLLPIYPSPLRDDGYDISDFYGIHPDYGSLHDFKTLLSEAHARGLRVITDLVLNHTSDQHPWFQEARRDRHSPYRDYYVWSDTDQKYRDARIIFIDTESSNWTWDPVAGQYYWHRFYSHQPDLNYDNPAVQEEMMRVMRFWLDMGIDGFRVDAVPYLFEREGTTCENLPETHAYVKRLRQLVDREYPGRILLGEVNQWPWDLVPYFGEGDELHMAFHFPLMPRIFRALGASDRGSLVQIMDHTPPIPPNCQWCTFLRNHDELTLEMVTGEERQWMWQEYAPDPRMRLNRGIRRRLAPLLDGDRRKLELAYSLLITLPGTPVLYYGDEIGMGDNVNLPDRDGVRTPMQWDTMTNAGFSATDPGKLFLPVIDQPPYSYRAVNVASQEDDPRSLLAWVRQAIALYKAHPALAYGQMRWLDGLDAGLAGYVRSTEAENLLMLQNLSAEPRELAVPWAALNARSALDLWTQRAMESGGPDLRLRLDPYGYRWLRLT